MGTISEATCNACQQVFELHLSGGFHFDLTRCVACGATQAVPPEADGTYDLERLVPASVIRPVRWKTRRRCRCGGRFSPDAPPRCPACRSADVIVGRVIAYYD